jgi:hypothetical protein
MFESRVTCNARGDGRATDVVVRVAPSGAPPTGECVAGGRFTLSVGAVSTPAPDPEDEIHHGGPAHGGVQY